MVGIGYRTLKTAVGAGLAIWLATLFHLEFATFSAIIVIMCIERTKKKTLLTMNEKFIASLLAVVLGAIFFEVLGYHPIVFSLFILLFIPVLVKLRIQGGFVTSMVVVLHIYTVKHFNMAVFWNEISIIIIGMGIALIVNSDMPNLKDDIVTYKNEIEQKFSVILQEFAASLRDHEQKWDALEIYEVEESINRAKAIAIQDVENHFLRKQNDDYYYLEMRENQLELLKHMVKIISVVSTSDLPVKQREMLASFLEDTSDNVHSGDTTNASLKKLDELMETIRETGLPKTREEFEVRANLYYLVFEMENNFKIKRKLFAGR